MYAIVRLWQLTSWGPISLVTAPWKPTLQSICAVKRRPFRYLLPTFICMSWPLGCLTYTLNAWQHTKWYLCSIYIIQLFSLINNAPNYTIPNHSPIRRVCVTSCGPPAIWLSDIHFMDEPLSASSAATFLELVYAMLRASNPPLIWTRE